MYTISTSRERLYVLSCFSVVPEEDPSGSSDEDDGFDETEEEDEDDVLPGMDLTAIEGTGAYCKETEEGFAAVSCNLFSHRLLVKKNWTFEAEQRGEYNGALFLWLQNLFIYFLQKVEIIILQLTGGVQSEVLEDENKSLLWTILKQVRPGMDLSRVVLPTFILEPRSFLDKLSDYYYHSDILAQ